MLHQVTTRIINDHGMRHSMLRQFPRSKSRPLIAQNDNDSYFTFLPESVFLFLLFPGNFFLALSFEPVLLLLETFLLSLLPL